MCTFWLELVGKCLRCAHVHLSRDFRPNRACCCDIYSVSSLTFTGNLVFCLSFPLSKVLLGESFGFITRELRSNRCQVHRRPSDRRVSECLETGIQIRSCDTSGNTRRLREVQQPSQLVGVKMTQSFHISVSLTGKGMFLVHVAFAQVWVGGAARS